MTFETWYLVLGVLLIAVVVAGTWLERLPATTTMLYLATGVALGPLGFQVTSLHPLEHTALLERLSEVTAVVSLFTAGLKLRLPLRNELWRVPIRLAFGSMAVTVGLVTVLGYWGLGLPLGAAVLLGAVLAPTDPVLASDVQLESPADRDKLRFSLTAEAGLNDGTAFPFVMLGVGLLGLHDLGSWGWRWIAVDVLWAISGGLAIGAVAGTLVARLVLHLRREHREGLGRDEFLALGLIGLSYGAALLAQTYGFLAVFAAGLALRAVERRDTGAAPRREVAAAAAAREAEEIATDHASTPAYMAEAVLGFNEQLERILEVALVLTVGMLAGPAHLHLEDLWVVPVLLLVVRPAAVLLGLAGGAAPGRKGMICWFGIRGIGSVYYLMHGIGYGVPAAVAQRLVSVTLWTIIASVVVHGISVTPLMTWYEAKRERRKREPPLRPSS
jgi:sodium/hydrogen antiporter